MANPEQAAVAGGEEEAIESSVAGSETEIWRRRTPMLLPSLSLSLSPLVFLLVTLAALRLLPGLASRPHHQRRRRRIASLCSCTAWAEESEAHSYI